MMYARLERRVCSLCKIAKEQKEFGRDRTNVSGLSCWCKDCKKMKRSERRKLNPLEASRRDFEADLRKHYGITAAQYQEMHDRQSGCCAICGQHAKEFKRRLHVDHDHVTGELRELLCTQCNPGLGYFGDDVGRLEKAIQYLKKFKRSG